MEPPDGGGAYDVALSFKHALVVTPLTKQRLFGDKIDIPTINGTAKLKIPSGIQPGQILRVKGKGFPLIGSSRRGDQLVKIQIDVPSKLNREEKKSTEDLLRIQKDKEIKFQRFED